LDDTPLEHPTKNVLSASAVLSKLRLIKSETELEFLRKAGKITSQSFIEAIKYTQPGMIENMIEAKLEFEMKVRGSDGLAYVPVCAGGDNANVIHYTTNKKPLKDGDMILVDAGCDYNHYVSDFTRTWPVGAQFSTPQKNLYNVVQRTLANLIPQCAEINNLSLDQLHVKAEEDLYDGLLSLGLKMPYKHIQKIFPHHIGHYVGLDVHDIEHESKADKLTAGAVIAVEPGLYIDYNDPYFPSQYHGLGIRLEDNVIVGLDRSENLAKDLPLLLSDIEALRKE
jgi:intermediate cleaving peptidase 55